MKSLPTKTGHHRLRVGWLDTFALRPFGERWNDAKMVFRGDPHVPPSRFGLTSIKLMRPSLSLPVWLGMRRKDRRSPIFNFFNHTPTPMEEGWSVRVTQVCDFRGGTLTYDSHNGTDFCVPVGTRVTAAASGRVLGVVNEFHRGGLKVIIDHGQGLLTGYNHLSRVLVRVGDEVRRGEVFALSGASGLELFALFPWIVPHIHFNVWLNGEYVDPFARVGVDELPLWMGGTHPMPFVGEGSMEEYKPTRWVPEMVQEAIQTCLSPSVKQRLLAIKEPDAQAVATLLQVNYYPGRWKQKPRLYAETFPRSQYLHLPLRPQDYVGICYPGFPA